MKQNDVIEIVKHQTFYQHNVENGTLDIALGIILIFLSLSLKTSHTSINLWIPFCGFTPSIIWSLKKRYVYPRLGYAVFKARAKFNGKLLLIGMGYLIFITVLGILSFSSYYPRNFNYSYMYPFTILGFSLMLIGGLRQSYKFYIYAALVFMPIAFPGLFNNHNSIFAILTMLALVFTIFLIENTLRNTSIDLVQVKQRYVSFIHYYIIFMAVILLFYSILSAFHVPLTKTISRFFDKHDLMLFGNLAALFLLFMGMAFRTARFVIYSLFLMLIMCLPYFIPFIQDRLALIVIELGVIIIGIGIILLVTFIKKYPVQEEPNEND
ncbi:MAG TPA: hypothetical protein PLE74_10650 [Candidatus Cloacimonadota bacterium]|nr:hypothetical protein [Candidatus Cloacimonadota bacterium]